MRTPTRTPSRASPTGSAGSSPLSSSPICASATAALLRIIGGVRQRVLTSPPLVLRHSATMLSGASGFRTNTMDHSSSGSSPSNASAMGGHVPPSGEFWQYGGTGQPSPTSAARTPTPAGSAAVDVHGEAAGTTESPAGQTTLTQLWGLE